MWYLIAALFAAIWTGLDAYGRRSNAVLYAVGAFLLAPIVVPVWIACRPLRAGETRDGGRAWNVLRAFAITWTIFMLIAAFVGLLAAARSAARAEGDAAQVGAGLGVLMGMGLLGATWFFPMVGTVVFGLILKKASENEVGPTGLLATTRYPPRGFAWTTGSTMGFTVLTVIVAVALGAGEHEAAATANAALPSEPLDAPNPSEGSATSPPHQNLSVASFKNDVLNKCVDVVVSTDDATDKAVWAKTFEGFVVLSQSCTEAFGDRTVFASCTTSVPTGSPQGGFGGHPWDALARYYNVETLDADDKYMKSCIAATCTDDPGCPTTTWWAMPHNDPAYVRERLRHDVRRLQRATGGAGGQ